MLKRLPPRERALEVFGLLRIWDTEENCGVLVYLLLADRDVEIVADRGIHGKVGAAAWEAVCRRMEAAFREGRFADGAEAGIAEINALLAQHFPRADQAGPNELPDRPSSCDARRSGRQAGGVPCTVDLSIPIRCSESPRA